MTIKTKNEVRNTSAEVAKNPLVGLSIAGIPGGIEASEARGQAELVRSEVLPAQMDPQSRKALESFGVQFGDMVEGDDLFIHALLPAGWTKRSTDHAMHSEVLDEQGRVRAKIFYKAAFYDRRADLQVTRRFTLEEDYSSENYDRRETEGRAFVKDAGKVIFDTGWHRRPAGQRWENPSWAVAKGWLLERHPDYENVMAYWNEP